MFAPLKLREAVLRARTYGETAELFGIGRATANQPLPRSRRHVSPIHGELAELLAAIVAEMPDATVVELAAVLMKQSGARQSAMTTSAWS